MATPLQSKIIDFIKDYLTSHKYSPSLTEIATGIGISPKSVSLISRNIHALVKAGRLTFHKKGYRNIEMGDSQNWQLPLTGCLSAAYPIEPLEGGQSVNVASLPKGEGCFALSVSGDFMADSGILHGDYLICKQPEVAREGDRVLAGVDNEAPQLQKISYQVPDRITLIPANPAIKPKAYLPHRVQIHGVFVGLLRLS